MAVPAGGRAAYGSGLVRRALALTVCTLTLAVSTGGLAVAQEAPPPGATGPEYRLLWNEQWRRFGTTELAAVSFLTVAAYGLQFLVIPDIGGTAGGVLLDEPARQLLHARTREGRALAGTVSDYLAEALILWPFAIDTAIVAWAIDSNRDVAGEMFWMGAMSLMTTAVALTFTKNVIRRERPYHDECVTDLAYDSGCTRPDRLRSFFSGHAAYAFTGAGLVCVHHNNFPLYGGGVLDTLACPVAMTMASAVAVLRMVADKHYLSDVLVGAVVGFAAGFLMPAALHYGWAFDRSAGAPQ